MASTRTTKRPKPRKKDAVLDERIVKAISHPIRHKVLVLLNDRVASPNEIANEIGESLGRVSYHVWRLGYLMFWIRSPLGRLGMVVVRALSMKSRKGGL